MSGFVSCRPFAGWSNCTLLAPAAVISVLLLGTGPAHAIPSPELIVGSFVSLSQLFALGSAILGGGAAYATMRARRGGTRAVSQSWVIAAVAVCVMLAGSVGLNVYQYVSHANDRQARLE
jgi:hypothetical protein